MNYIVSGLERSGTSLMMQILERAGVDIAYNDSRPPDENNPKGYYELYGGRILNHIDDIDFNKYNNKVIKITSFGIKNLPIGNYKIIYMIRDIEEIYESQKKMMNGKPLEKNKTQSIQLLTKLNLSSMHDISLRKDMDVIYIHYDILMDNPDIELDRLSTFLKYDISKGKKAINKNLWRNRK